MMTTISNRSPEVYVHYDSCAGRTSKHFTDAYAARRFYMAKDKLGKNPRVSKDPHFEELNMSDVTPVEAAAITKASKAKAAKRTTRKAKVTTPAKARKATSKKPVPKTPAKGKAKAAAAPKKSKGKVKAAPKASANSKRKSCGLPIAEKRERFLKTLKKLQATSAIAAVTGVKISETDGTLTAFDCACLGWYKGPLVTDGLVKIAKLEDVRALSYYLTAKGKKQ